MSRVIYACDVGSTKSGAFAWARTLPTRSVPSAGRNIATLVSSIIADAESGLSISLGFESPLFLPVPRRHDNLSSGRSGESNRSMFAPVGAGVTTLGVHQAAWILRAVGDKAGDLLEYVTDWRQWPPLDGSPRFLVWEAFVSGNAHSLSHENDAVTAAMYFREKEGSLGAAHAVSAEDPFSLIHAVAMWAGWATDLDRLHCECLVLKPESAYIEEWVSA
jgi:hypothetical protein